MSACLSVNEQLAGGNEHVFILNFLHLALYRDPQMSFESSGDKRRTR